MWSLLDRKPISTELNETEQNIYKQQILIIIGNNKKKWAFDSCLHVVRKEETEQ